MYEKLCIFPHIEMLYLGVKLERQPHVEPIRNASLKMPWRTTYVPSQIQKRKERNTKFVEIESQLWWTGICLLSNDYLSYLNWQHIECCWMQFDKRNIVIFHLPNDSALCEFRLDYTKGWCEIRGIFQQREQKP